MSQYERIVARIKAIPDYCSGADDPEDRCPRHPKDCVCWRFSPEARGLIEVGDGAIARNAMLKTLEDLAK